MRLGSGVGFGIRFGIGSVLDLRNGVFCLFGIGFGDRIRDSVRDGRFRVHWLDPGPLVPGFLGTWIPLI